MFLNLQLMKKMFSEVAGFCFYWVNVEFDFQIKFAETMQQWDAGGK